MSGKTERVRVSSWLERSVAHGPGERFVLWVQGCHLNCPGCFSQHTHDFNQGVDVQPNVIVRMVEMVKHVEGITISGGEPMLQASALAIVARKLRDRGLTTMCYSGFTLSELRTNPYPGVEDLLESIDILVDGRYQATERGAMRWRGSRNQQVQFLSDAYRHLKEQVETSATNVELVIDQNGFTTTGIWPHGLIQRLTGATQC